MTLMTVLMLLLVMKAMTVEVVVVMLLLLTIVMMSMTNWLFSSTYLGDPTWPNYCPFLGPL